MKLVFKTFSAIFTVKDAARVIVYEILNVFYVTIRDIRNRGALRDKATDKAVLILVRSSFGRTIGMTIKHRSTFLSGIR